MTEASGQHHENAGDAATAPESPAAGDGAKMHRARGLLLIGLFKLSKALFFFAVGIGALHLVHKNVGDLFLRLASFLHFDPDAPLIAKLQDKVDLISGHQLRQLSLGTFGYATLSLVEGVGLMLEQTWAEYLTLTLTICALPWELYELIRDPTAVRAGLLLVNLAVLAYLLWFIRWHRRQMHKHAIGGTDAKPDGPAPLSGQA